MMYIKSLFIQFVLILFAPQLIAQNNENSPLSRYALGDLRIASTGWMAGMANAGTGFISEQLYNPLNPATTAFLKQTDMEIGVYARQNKLEEASGNTLKDWSGNINNIQLAIPLRNAINELLDRKKYTHTYAVQIGLCPYSSVGYRSETVDSSDKNNQLNRIVQGDGLIQNFQLGFAYRYKDLAIGLRMNYLFGNLNFNQNLYFNSLPASYDSYLNDKVHLSGWQPVLGFSYRKILNQAQLNKDNSLRRQIFSAGLVFDLPVNYNSSYSALHQTRFEDNLGVVDTVLYVNELTEKGKLPFGLQAGIAYAHKDKYGLMASFHWTDWKNASLTKGLIGTTKSSNRLAVATWLKPGQNSFDNFIKKSTYRFGAYLENDYRTIDNAEIKGLGLSVGWSYPIIFLRQDAMFHLNVDFGQRKLEERLKENYINIHFGISINDNEWFLKRKYN